MFSDGQAAKGICVDENWPSGLI